MIDKQTDRTILARTCFEVSVIYVGDYCIILFYFCVYLVLLSGRMVCVVRDCWSQGSRRSELKRKEIEPRAFSDGNWEHGQHGGIVRNRPLGVTRELSDAGKVEDKIIGKEETKEPRGRAAIVMIIYMDNKSTKSSDSEQWGTVTWWNSSKNWWFLG